MSKHIVFVWVTVDNIYNLQHNNELLNNIRDIY